MKQVRNCRVGDIILFKNKESRRIENDPHKREPYKIYTTDLGGENPHCNAYAADDRVIYRGAQEVLI